MVIAGYVLGNVLGEGAFALTRIGYKELTPDQPVAVKSILRSHPRFNYEEISSRLLPPPLSPSARALSLSPYLVRV
jgi:hypothetical protein